MFTGIIEEIGTVENITSNEITINCSKVLQESKLGDSIAVNGVCLTIVKQTNTTFSANLSQETYNVTDFDSLKRGSSVNLERALTLSSRLGGHIVSGHIDTVGKVHKINKIGDFYNIEITFDKKYNNLIIKKGSITINGISLTIAEVSENSVKIAVIPHTYKNTVLNELKPGDTVNIEFDTIAKYVEKNLLSKDNGNITIDLLNKSGFC